jgi:hypothetical protein
MLWDVGAPDPEEQYASCAHVGQVDLIERTAHRFIDFGAVRVPHPVGERSFYFHPTRFGDVPE